MSNVVKRGTSQLAPKRWRAIVILTDTPDAGEAHLTKDELLDAVGRGLDLPAGVAFEFGAVETASPSAAIEELKK
jgi:hypothetical protein